MKRILFFISTFLLVPYAIFAAEGACTIENGPPEKLKNYIRETEAKLGKISSAGRINSCGGTFANERKFIEAIDRIETQSKLDTDFVVDFRYNVDVAAAGNSRSQVINQGIIIQNLDKKIISTLKMAANGCNLDIPVASMSGKTIETLLSEMLTYNRKVHSFYKSVVTGNIALPSGIDTPEKKALFEAIASNYSPAAVSGCKNQYKWEEIVAKFQGTVDMNFKNIGNSFDGWKRAIAIFRGNISQTEYQELQKRLLQRELAGQGLSRTAQSIMLGNLSCFQRDTNKTSIVEDLSKTRATCMQSVVQGLENITNPLETSFLKVTNTDAYIQKLLTIKKEKAINIDDMSNLWAELDTIISNNAETSMNEQTLSDLVSIHFDLVQINKLLKQKIPEMQRNCMKANPGIVGGCRD